MPSKSSTTGQSANQSPSSAKRTTAKPVKRLPASIASREPCACRIDSNPTRKDGSKPEILATDIPAIWIAATTTDTDRKKLLHAIVESVTVQAQGTSERVRAVIHWAGGATTSADLVRPVARVDQLSYYPRLVERLTALATGGLPVKAIAEQLEAEGLRPPHLGRRFHHGEVQHLIRRLGIRPGLEADRRSDHGALGPDQWWLAALAREIEMPQATLFNWLRRGWVTGRQDARAPYRWIITADQAEVERLKQLRSLPHGDHNRRHWADAITRTTETARKEAGTHDRTL